LTNGNGQSSFYQQVQTAKERAKVCWPDAPSVTLHIPPSDSVQQTFRISGEGDFLIEYLVGSMFAYDPSTLVVVPSVITGIYFQINESGNSRDLFDSPVPAQNILTPGYGSTIYEKWNLRNYWLKATTTVRVTANNTNATYSQQLDISFLGHQGRGGPV
jgi:hypothetical protein